MQWTLVTPSRAAARTSARLSSKKSIEPSGTPCPRTDGWSDDKRALGCGLLAREGERERAPAVGGWPCGEGAAWEATHRAPLDLLEVQWLGPVLDDDGAGADHVGGGAAARLESQHLEPLSRPRPSVSTRGYGDRHVGVGELEQRTPAGGVKLEQLAARALDATESVVYWREG
jgi:hypothetical protein